MEMGTRKCMQTVRQHSRGVRAGWGQVKDAVEDEADDMQYIKTKICLYSYGWEAAEGIDVI